MSIEPDAKNKINVLIGAGIFSGILLFFSPGTVFMLILAVGTVFFIRRISDQEERRFILVIFTAGLGIRMLLTVLTMLFCAFSGRLLNYASLGLPNYNAPYLLDDCGYYTLRSLFTSMYWSGVPFSPSAIKGIINLEYGSSGFIYILAAFFGLFGYAPVASKFLNCFFGIWTALAVYFIAKNIFGAKTARLSTGFAAFFPSLFIWSITNLKEPIFIFLIYTMLWAVIKSVATRKIRYLTIALLAARLQLFIRSTYEVFFYLTLGTMLLYYLFVLSINLYKKKRALLLGILLISAVVFAWPARHRINTLLDAGIRRIQIAHNGAVSTGGQTYKLLPDIYYQITNKPITKPVFLTMLFKGWIHILLEPFPWKILTKSIFFSYPQMLLWYVLVVYAVLGAGFSLKYRFKESLILILYFFVITSGLAVTGGNIGTIFRFRDIITPLVLIFAAVGLTNMFNPPVLSKPQQGPGL